MGRKVPILSSSLFCDDILRGRVVVVFLRKKILSLFVEQNRDMLWLLEYMEETLRSIEQSFKELKSAQEKGENLPGVEELFEALQTA